MLSVSGAKLCGEEPVWFGNRDALRGFYILILRWIWRPLNPF